MKTFLKFILFLAIILGALYFCWQSGLLDKYLNKDNELKIDKTENIIEEIKKISEFTTTCFYEELVLNEKKASKWVDNKAGSLLSKITGKEKSDIASDDIAIIAKGKVRAGFDLSNMSDSTLAFHGDTIVMTLPKAEIFDVIINPSGFEIYNEEGTWSHEQITEIENKAKDKLQQDAIESGILEKAETSGKAKLSDLFKSFGYKVVKFN